MSFPLAVRAPWNNMRVFALGGNAFLALPIMTGLQKGNCRLGIVNLKLASPISSGRRRYGLVAYTLRGPRLARAPQGDESHSAFSFI
jgi:hypothetical protein